MKTSLKVLIGALAGTLIACLLLLFIIDFEKNKPVTVLEPIMQVDAGNVKEEEEEPEPVITKTTIELAMIGDILLHTELAVYEDFSSSFSAMEPYLQGYDYLIANQESLPVGNKFNISGYPQFASPEYIIRDLQEAGVDMLNIANNHTVDKGEDGLRTAFENMERYNIPYVGAYQNAEDRATHRIIEVDGIKIGFVSYTYETNGLYLPKSSPFSVNYIDIKQMMADVEEIKPLVDVTVAIVHWGYEYVTEENENQRYIATMLNQAGADIIFGGHPHVLQPYSKMVNGAGQETHIFYSLGNFFARTISSKDTMIGGIGSFEITKEAEVVTISNPKLIASSLLKDPDGVYRIYPLKEVEERSVRNMDWVKKVLGGEVDVQ